MATDTSPDRVRPVAARQAVATFLVALSAIVLVRFSIVASPPYWDQAMGLWAEADAIVAGGFDIQHHLFEEKHFLQGGRATYRWSLAPFFVGALMWIGGSSARFAIVSCHVLTFIGAALIATVVFESLRRAVGLWKSLLATMALMTVPIVCTQFDMVGQEIPLTAFAVLAGLAVGKQRYGWAAAAGLLAFFTKQSGIVVGTAVAIQAALACWTGKPTNDAKRSLKPLAFALLALGIEAFFASRDTGGLSRFLRINPFVLLHLAVWAPYFSLAIAASLAAFVFSVLFHPPARNVCPPNRRAHATVDGGFPIRTRLASLVERDADVLFAALMVSGVIALGMLVPALARYFVLAAPFVFLLLGKIALTSPRYGRYGTWSLAALVVINLLNWNGLLMPSPAVALSVELFRPAAALAREGSTLERNHLYLADHRSNQQAVRAIENNAGDDPVFAGMPFTYFLTLPRLGYVNRPVRCYPTSSFGQSPSLLATIAELIRQAPAEAVFVRVPNALSQDWRIFDVPSPEPEDEILFEDALEPRLVVFRKDLSRTLTSREERRAWYAKRFWPLVPYFEPDRNAPDALSAYRVRQWIRAGLADLAQEELEAALDRYPNSSRLQHLQNTLSALSSQATSEKAKSPQN